MSKPVAQSNETDPATESPSAIVAVCASTENLASLTRCLSGVPKDSGLAFIVMLRAPPEVPQHLVSQLSIKVPVVIAVDGEPLEPNRVYVLPARTSARLRDGRLETVTTGGGVEQESAIDLSLRALAEAGGANVTAIVLSGAGYHGGEGLERVRQRGGLTIAEGAGEGERSAVAAAAVNPTLIDWVLSAAEMPARIAEYHRRELRLHTSLEDAPSSVRRQALPGREEQLFSEISALVRAVSGRDFERHERALVARRLAHRMRVTGCDDLASYVAHLVEHPEEVAALSQAPFASTCAFFDDREACERLARHIPTLFEGKSCKDAVRVWVPGCGTGQEAYSIAILLFEYARTLPAPPSLQVFATDMDEAALAEARSGFYSDVIAADVRPDLLTRYFTKQHRGYRIVRELRDVVLFAAHDLFFDPPFSRLDMISCRNVLGTLNVDARQRALLTFHFALHGRGSLFLGREQITDDLSPKFDREPEDLGTFIAVPRQQAHVPRPIRGRSRGALRSAGPTIAAVAGMEAPSDDTRIELATPKPNVMQKPLPVFELHSALIARIAPPSLIVDASFQIRSLAPNVGQFMRNGADGASSSVLRAIHPALHAELSAALVRCRDTLRATSALDVPFDTEERSQSVDLHVSPVGSEGEELFLIVLDETRRTRPAHVHVDKGALTEHLERELVATQRRMREAVHEHQASMEELEASNEELQALNSELTRSREELQSMNEELRTLNQELKNRVDEAIQANSDLTNLIAATAIPTLFLNLDLRIKRFTPSAAPLFNLIQSDVGRPLADLRHDLDYPDLISDACRVIAGGAPMEREVREVYGRFFLARILPYHTAGDRVDGVVLTFVDITERQLAAEVVRRAHEELEQRVRERTAQLDAANDALRKEVIEHQRAERSRQELQRRLVSAQEEERGRISRELHDEVGQQLTAVMLSLKALETAVDGESAAEQLRMLHTTTQQAAKELHQLATELRPIALDDFGLPRALATYVQSWSTRTGIAVDFVCAGMEQRRLPRTIETTLYRIVQEAMNNIYKHAHARNVTVSVERDGDRVLGVIEDDGLGFDDDGVAHAESQRIGVAGMRERAAIVGGSLTIDSAAGRGTTVRVEIPLS